MRGVLNVHPFLCDKFRNRYLSLSAPVRAGGVLSPGMEGNVQVGEEFVLEVRSTGAADRVYDRSVHASTAFMRMPQDKQKTSDSGRGSRRRNSTWCPQPGHTYSKPCRSIIPQPPEKEVQSHPHEMGFRNAMGLGQAIELLHGLLINSYEELLGVPASGAVRQEGLQIGFAQLVEHIPNDSTREINLSSSLANVAPTHPSHDPRYGLNLVRLIVSRGGSVAAATGRGVPRGREPGGVRPASGPAAARPSLPSRSAHPRGRIHSAMYPTTPRRRPAALSSALADRHSGAG